MSVPTFWTAADAAELELRSWDLVTAIYHHGCRGACDSCRRLIEDVVEWRGRRILQSRSEWLRRKQIAFDLDLERRAGSIAGLVRLLRETNPYKDRGP